MSFGKRGTGEGHPARNLVPPPVVTEGGGAARMTVANPGGIDKGFIALAFGVVVLSAGAAMAAPSVMDMFGGSIPVRPLSEVVAGLDRDQAKTALAREAFPDGEGRAFMTSLAANFPADHDRLLGDLADEAMKIGADRDDLVNATSDWSVEFIPAHMQEIGRTGSEGFDNVMTIATDALGVVEKAAGECTLPAFQQLAAHPTALADLAAYGGEGYKVGMRAGRAMVDLAAKGRNAGQVDMELTQDDQSALQTTFFSMMMDKQVMGLMASGMNGGGPIGAGADAVDPSKVDVCQLGRTIIVKLKKLPDPTKGRIFALATSGINPQMMAAISRLNATQGGMPGGNAYGTFSAGSPSSRSPSSSNSSITNPKITLQFKGPGLGNH
ncbi:MAG: hypothetical protein QM773_17535 [Hyphomonadaceae bacterium]